MGMFNKVAGQANKMIGNAGAAAKGISRNTSLGKFGGTAKPAGFLKQMGHEWGGNFTRAEAMGHIPQQMAMGGAVGAVIGGATADPGESMGGRAIAGGMIGGAFGGLTGAANLMRASTKGKIVNRVGGRSVKMGMGDLVPGARAAGLKAKKASVRAGIQSKSNARNFDPNLEKEFTRAAKAAAPNSDTNRKAQAAAARAADRQMKAASNAAKNMNKAARRQAKFNPQNAMEVNEMSAKDFLRQKRQADIATKSQAQKARNAGVNAYDVSDMGSVESINATSISPWSKGRARQKGQPGKMTGGDARVTPSAMPNGGAYRSNVASNANQAPGYRDLEGRR